MSDTVQIVTTVCTLIGTIVTGWIAYKVAVLNHKQEAIGTTVVKMADTVEVVKKATDGLTTKLVASTERAAKSEGVAQGRAEKGAEVKAEVDTNSGESVR